MDYVEHLSGVGIPPTGSVIQSFASEIAGKRVGEGWVTRFSNRNEDHLISRWSSGNDRTRHKFDHTSSISCTLTSSTAR